MFGRSQLGGTHALGLVEEGQDYAVASQMKALVAPGDEGEIAGLDCFFDPCVVFRSDGVACLPQVAWIGGTIGKQVDHQQATISPIVRESYDASDGGVVGGFVGLGWVQTNGHHGSVAFRNLPP